MTWLWFALENVRRNGRRAVLTLLIAAVGAAALLVFGGYCQFVYAALQQQAARESGHLVLAHSRYFDGDEDAPMQHGLPDPAALEAALQEDPRVRAVLPRLAFTGLVSNGEKSAVFVGSGVDAAAEFKVRGPFLKFTEGKALSSTPAAGDLPEVLLGKELARSLKAAPGTVLTLMTTTTEGSLNAQDVRVQGVYSVGIDDLDRRAVMVHLPTAQKLLLTDRVSTLSVHLFGMEDVAPARAAVAARFPGLALRTWEDEAVYYGAVRNMFDRIFGLIGLVILVLVLFAISNTIGMAVVERTREIGTLRAQGASPGLVTRNFVLEGAVIGAGGALLGAALALGVALLVSALDVRMPPPPGQSAGYPLRVDLTAALFLGTSLAVTLAAAVAAWGASRRAAARPIVEALTHV